MADPHTAVGLKVALDFKKKEGYKDKSFIVLQTANPAKFKEVIQEKLGVEISMPDDTKALMARSERCFFINPNYKEFKDWLFSLKD